jgi:hypothetical protein
MDLRATWNLRLSPPAVHKRSTTRQRGAHHGQRHTNHREGISGRRSCQCKSEFLPSAQLLQHSSIAHSFRHADDRGPDGDGDGDHGLLGLNRVFVGGGIALKILAMPLGGSFMRGFTDKGRFSGLMKSMEVSVALNPAAPLIGAAYFALKLALAESAREGRVVNVRSKVQNQGG